MAPTTVDQIGTENSKLVIAGWFLGLAVFQWFSSSAIPLAWWLHLILIVGGMFAASIFIGGGVTLLAALLNKSAFGDPEARPHLFKLAGLIAAVLAFFAAALAAKLAATIQS